MISPGKRWFLYRSLVAGGVMSGCLSWSSSGQGGVIIRAIMSWVRKQVQQVDKTNVRVCARRNYRDSCTHKTIRSSLFTAQTGNFLHEVDNAIQNGHSRAEFELFTTRPFECE